MTVSETILVSGGNWRRPVYAREDKTSYYAKLRKPLIGPSPANSDPTTHKLTQDLAKVGVTSAWKIVEAAMQSQHVKTKGFLRTIWVWGMGYVLRETFADPRVVVAVGTGGPELTSNYEQFEAVRQEMLDFEELADAMDNSELRASARRSLLEYFNIRSFRRITGQGNAPIVNWENDALNTLTIGGNWVGAVYELASLAFPQLDKKYNPPAWIEHVSAITNAIASCPRDQREGTTNSLVFIFRQKGAELAQDMMDIAAYIDNAHGPEMSMIGHFVAANNNHSRYIMIAVFLAAARLGNVSIHTSGGIEVWKLKAVEYAKKTAVPEGCLSTTQEEWEPRIMEGISSLWPHLEEAEKQGTDESIQTCQRAIHKFVDQELQGICWKQRDPVVLWGTCAALYWTLSHIEGIAQFLLRGDEFKTLYVESEGYEEEWLQAIYASKPKNVS